ncbi:hypothetical protein CsatB_019065 [Cannabis sativa]
MLTKFLKCMNNKKPLVVITDGDPAMKVAIDMIIQGAFHRSCTWHICNNVFKRVRDPHFKTNFKRLMYKYMSEEEFEMEWKNLMDEYDLHGSEWCIKSYNERHTWGEAFVKGHFCGGTRTTQRNESMNSALKKFLEACYPIREFISCIDLACMKLQHTEAQRTFISKFTTAQLPPFTDPVRPYYKNAAEIYTRDIYYKVVEQIKDERACVVFNLEDFGDHLLLSFNRFQHGQIRYKVQYYKINNHFSCDCLLFETDDYPCKHIWACMKYLNIMLILPSLILKRWTNDAKLTTLTTSNEVGSTEQDELIQMARYDSLNSDTNLLNIYALTLDNSFAYVNNKIAHLTAYCKDAFDQTSKQDEQASESSRGHQDNPNIVRDSINVKTKGMGNQQGGRSDGNDNESGKKERECKICKGTGHNLLTCPQRPQTMHHKQIASSSRRASPLSHGGSIEHSQTSSFMYDDSTQDSLHSFN